MTFTTIVNGLKLCMNLDMYHFLLSTLVKKCYVLKRTLLGTSEMLHQERVIASKPGNFSLSLGLKLSSDF